MCTECIEVTITRRHLLRERFHQALLLTHAKKIDEFEIKKIILCVDVTTNSSN